MPEPKPGERTSDTPRVRRRLDTELVRIGLATSRTRAVELVALGQVEIDGRRATRPGQDVTGGRITLHTGDHTDVNGPAPGSGPPADRADGGSGDTAGGLASDVELASRGGRKLAGALAEFAAGGPEFPTLRIEGRRCLDAGASTGGFTDVLLRLGAREVVAVDVGHGQLIDRLRADPHVQVHEGVNVRTLTATDIEGPADLTVADLSFISLPLVMDALIACTVETGDLLLLVKPQFEVGRSRLGRGGVVRSTADRRDAVAGVAVAAQDRGWGVRSLIRSALPGPAGNVEFFLWLRRDAAPLDPAVLHHVSIGTDTDARDPSRRSNGKRGQSR